MLKLSILLLNGNDAKNYKNLINKSEIRGFADKSQKICNKTFCTNDILILNFIDDIRIRELNKKWRKIDKATDVLSFSYIEKDQFPDLNNDHEKVLGEIFISLDTANIQATEHSHSLQKEVNKLFVHGILHIFGYTHDSEKDFLEMNFLEKSILND